MNPQSDSDELNNLGYASSAPDFVGLAPASQTKAQDEADLPTLQVLSRVLAHRRAKYDSVQSLTLGDITVENQMIINKKIVFHLQELENLVNTTIQRVKEKLNDRA